MTSSRSKNRKWIWTLALAVGLIAEIVFITLSCVSLLDGYDQIPLWKATLFVGIAVWIYIAYLKQRTYDISRFVVDEKIKTHLLVQNLREGMIVTDPENRILILNTKASEITGLPEIECLGQDLSSKVDARISSLLTSGQEGETSGSIAETGQNVHMSIINFSTDKNKAAHKLIYVEKTQEIPAEDAAPPMPQDQVRAAGDLKVLAEELLDPDDISRNEEDRMRRFRLGLRGLATSLEVSNIATLNRVRVGLLSANIKKEGLSAREMLNDLLKEIMPAAQANGIMINIAKGNNELVIMGDRELLGLALRQIIFNAALGIPGHEGAINICMASMGDNTGIAIADNGAAIADSSLSQLFSYPYAGLNDDRGQKIRTDSTGLLMARGIIEAHGGTLVAENPPDGGLRITVMISGKD